jgi:GNAT superfamily N-acetyltransferase
MPEGISPEQSDELKTPRSDAKTITAEALQAMPVRAIWREVPTDRFGMIEMTNQLELTIGTGDITTAPASLGAELTQDWHGNPLMASETVRVDEDFQGNRLGEKLARSLAVIAVNNGCKKIMADYRDPRSLKQAINIFGFERLHFVGDANNPELKITEEQALELVTRRRASTESENLSDVPATPAWIDIEGLDVSDWEAPEEVRI